MSCCFNDISASDFITELPCCGIIQHSKCVIDRIEIAALNETPLQCHRCQKLLFYLERPYFTPAPLTSECIDDLQESKQLADSYKSTFVKFGKSLRAEKNALKETIADLVNQIRQERMKSIANIKESSEYKEHMKNYKAYIKKIKQISKTHDVSRGRLYKHHNVKSWDSPLLRIKWTLQRYLNR